MKEGKAMKKMIFFSTQKGFTLIEVLLSVSLLGIISVSVLSFFNQSYDYTKNNQSKTVGINVARNVVNYIEQLDFDKTMTYLTNTTTSPLVINKSNCADLSSDATCQRIFESVINNVRYEAVVTLNKYEKDPTEKIDAEVETPLKLEESLIPISVNVTWNEQETTVKGIIKK